MPRYLESQVGDMGAETSASLEMPSRVTLDLPGGDVWAWEKTVSGTCVGVTADTAIELLLNDESLPVNLDAGSFHATVRLNPGENVVQAVVTHPDGSRVASAPVKHNVRLAPRPIARISMAIEGENLVLDGRSSTSSEYDSSAISSYAWEFQGTGLPASKSASPFVGDKWTLPLPQEDGEYYAILTVTDEQGRRDTSTCVLVVEHGSARVKDVLKEEASWIMRATVYGVVVRNVGPHGFQSVIDHLDQLAKLGITALWFTPITRTPEGDFGYAVTDYFDVEPKYGTLSDFRRLVKEAHARNIRVLIDLVPNHTSSEHPYFKDAEQNGSGSQYYDYYDRDEHGRATHYFNWHHLPNLNFDHPEVRRFITEAFMFWVRELDVDGFRVDVAWGIRQRCPEYWREFSAEFHRVKPDGLLIAEASARDPYYVNNGFNAAYDWTDELGVWAWNDVFGSDVPMSQGMKQALANSAGGGYDPDSLILRFLNNNDTGPRFITTYGVDFYRVASAMLMTLPGIPCLFTGDEVGAEFEPYKTGNPIDWTDRHGLRAHFTRLINLRSRHPSLQSREWTDLLAEPSAQIFGYLRPATDISPSLIILLNFSGDSVDATINSANSLGVTASKTLNDLYNDELIHIEGGAIADIHMPAWSVRVLEVEDG